MDKLIFIYNADSGLFNALTDYAHKVVSPNTYSCNLCKLTYGNLGMRRDWKDFIESLPFDKAFLHRNEFGARYPQFADISLPAIFKIERDTPILLLSAGEINSAEDLNELKELLSKKFMDRECQRDTLNLITNNKK